MRDNVRQWLWLVMVFGPANNRIWLLSNEHNSVTEFYHALKNGLVEGLTQYEQRNINSISDDDVTSVIDKCSNQNLEIISFESEGFPQSLREISNPPAVLFSNASLDFLNEKTCVAVIGTRNPSEYTMTVLPKLCQPLTELGLCLCSGYADGVDRAANRIAIDGKTMTTAFLGRCHENENDHDFMNEISHHGAVVSEYYPGCKTMTQSFVNRNRLLVGVSKAVVICEAKADSRGLDNVRHAVTQGKQIFVVPPHDIFDPRYFGQRDLLRNNCIPVQSGADIVYALTQDKPEAVGIYQLNSEDSYMYNPQTTTEKQKNKSRGIRQSKSHEPVVKKVIDMSKYSQVEQSIIKCLENKNMLADEISAVIGENIPNVLSHLTELELDGVVASYAGKMYGLVNK